MKNRNVLVFPIISLLFLLFIFSCAPLTRITDIQPIADSLKITESSQVLVITNNCSASSLVDIFSLEKKNNRWKQLQPPLSGVIGRNGFAGPGEKREGDGKTPSGIFPLKTTFGYQETIRTKMPYRRALPDDLWIDDVNTDDYNHWAKKEETKASSFEYLRREDNLYKYGIIIEYNTSPVVKGYGSAIFMHVWKDENTSTAGCVAISEDDIVKILGWLDPQASPLVILGTQNSIERLIQ